MNLEEKALWLRQSILDMVFEAQSGHIGGSFSSVELLLMLFDQYFSHQSDVFVLSKGHVTPLYYSLLAFYQYIPVTMLKNFRKMGSALQGHPDRHFLNCVEVSTGSLGQGVGVAGGMALDILKEGQDHKVYVLLGDGECQEGCVWEVLMAAAHFKLSNLCIMIDNNKVQTDGKTDTIMSIEYIDQKLKAFNFEVLRIDGHSFSDLNQAFDTFIHRQESEQPFAIVADTIKGKGVSFMENNSAWHGTAPSKTLYEQAKRELI